MIEANLPLLLDILGVAVTAVLAVLVLFLSDAALVTIMATGCELVVVTPESCRAMVGVMTLSATAGTLDTLVTPLCRDRLCGKRQSVY